MTHRDLHPNDLVLIYGDVRVVERVDVTHIATRGPKDSLELWSYDGEVIPINIDNKLILKSLGFYEEDNLLKYDEEFGPIEINYLTRCVDIVYNKEGYTGRKSVENLNDIQQFYYHLTGKEIKLIYEGISNSGCPRT